MNRYTLEAGRHILKDGVPFCNLHGCIEPRSNRLLYDPCELDKFAVDIVHEFNRLDAFTANPVIRTKYLSATNRRGSRIRATNGTESVTIPYNASTPPKASHLKAARNLMQKVGLTGQLIAGTSVGGYTFVVRI